MIFSADCEMSKEVARAVRVLAPANAAFVSSLARIVDVTQLTEGDDEYDYFVTVPAARLHELGQRISDLKFAIQDKYGVMITIMPLPAPMGHSETRAGASPTTP
jgi:hypothetical protein